MNFVDTIMGKITMDALMNWNGLSKEEALKKVETFENGDTAKDNVTYGSELSAMAAIIKIVGLSKEDAELLKNDVYTSNAVSQELSNAIKGVLPTNGLEQNIFKILSVIHDQWVKDNGNKFEARPKNHQFVPLELLPFGEVESDLLFLEPILNGCGITVNRELLKKVHNENQVKLLKEKNITTHEDLVALLKTGEDFYPTLNGVTTNCGNKDNDKKLIVELLKDDNIAEKTAQQIEAKLNLFKTKSNESSDERS